MEFKRKIYEQIKEWKREENKNSALLIEGARRVGKTKLLKNLLKMNIIILFTLISHTLQTRLKTFLKT